MTPSQQQELSRRATEAGMTISEFVRASTTGTHRISPELYERVAKLARMADLSVATVIERLAMSRIAQTEAVVLSAEVPLDFVERNFEYAYPELQDRLRNHDLSQIRDFAVVYSMRKQAEIEKATKQEGAAK